MRALSTSLLPSLPPLPPLWHTRLVIGRPPIVRCRSLHNPPLACLRRRASRLEITFGFEAVAHALYACERVSLYGFFLDPEDAKRQTNGAASQAMETPYHYYENRTYDKSAKDPWRPWTYRFHNFGLEHSKFRQLQRACWLRLVT